MSSSHHQFELPRGDVNLLGIPLNFQLHLHASPHSKPLELGINILSITLSSESLQPANVRVLLE